MVDRHYQCQVQYRDKLKEVPEPGKEHDRIVAFIKELQKKHCMECRRWWIIRSSLPEGPITRGFELWRLNPKWNMHPVIREECAGFGGCCA